jgi:hypothetical protein
MNRFLSVVAVLLACVLVVGGQSQTPGADPFNGTWSRNLAKSTFSPGPPPPATSTDIRRFSTLEGGWSLFEQSGVNAQGDPIFQSVAYKIDGKPYPVMTQPAISGFLTTGKPSTTTRSYRRIDASSVEFTSYNNGVAGIPTVRTVAKDGKSYTETTKGTGPKGQAVNNVVVFDRVR